MFSTESSFKYSGKFEKHLSRRNMYIIACVAVTLAISAGCLFRIVHLMSQNADTFLQEESVQSASILDGRMNERITGLSAMGGMLSAIDSGDYAKRISILRAHTDEYKRMGIITADGMVYSTAEDARTLQSSPEIIKALVSAKASAYGLITPPFMDSDEKSAIACAVDIPEIGGARGILYGVLPIETFTHIIMGDAMYDKYICVTDQHGAVIMATTLMDGLLNDDAAIASSLKAVVLNSARNNYSVLGWNDYRLATAQLGYNGWLLVRLKPNSEVMELGARAVALYICIVLAAIALLISSISYVLLKRAHSSESMAREAGIDPLTNISNHLGFAKSAATLMARANAPRYALVLMYTDAQSVYGARYGYESGRRALENVARTLSSECEQGETCARLDDGQFALLLRFSDTADMLLRVKALNSRIMALGALRTRVHYGVYPPRDGDKATLNEMIECASAAEHRVMRKGDLVGLYDDALHRKQQSEDALISRAAAALQNGEFEVCYRPLRDINTLEIVGAEAIALWRQPDGSTLAPAEYMPLLTRNSMTGPLNMFVMERACQELKAEADAGRTPGRILLNFSRENLVDGTFMPMAKQLLTKYGVSGKRFEAIFDESAFCDDAALLKSVLQQMRLDELRVCVGGFGQGTTSLAIFDDMPIDSLRLAGEFVARTCASERGEQLLTGVASLAKALNIDVYADGHITHEQLEALRKIGCIKVEREHDSNIPGCEYCKLSEIKPEPLEKSDDPFDDWA